MSSSEKNVELSRDTVTEEKEDVRMSIETEDNETIVRQPPDGGRAWLVLFGCFCGLFCTQGYNYTWGIFLNYYDHNIYKDQMTQLSWVGSLWLALANIVGPFYGYLACRVGYKWMLCTAVVLCTLAMMLASIATEIWQLYLTQGVMAGIGASLVWFPCVSAPQQWFSKRRGLAVGIAISGSGFGGLIMSNIIQAVIDSLGVYWALRVIGFISLVMLTISTLTVRPLNPLPRTTKISTFNFKPFCNTQFCMLFIIQLLSNFAFNVPSSFLPEYATWLGLSDWVSSNMPAILSGVMILGKISSGLFGDLIGRANMLAICVTMTGVVTLAVWLPAKSAAAVWAFAALFGYFGGGYMVVVPAVLAQVVGLDDIEAANGLLFFAWFFGGLLGSPLSSALINIGDDGRTYWRAIVFAGAIMVGTGVLAIAIRVMRGGWYPFKRV